MTCALLVLLAFPQERTLRVPEDYPGIQAALDGAAAGDRVLVAAGTYEGPFSVRKALLVEGSDGTILRGGGPILTVTASGAKLRRLDFRKGGKAVVIEGARDVEVSDCRFSGNGGDQLSFEHGGGSVRRCRFEDAGDDNIDIDGASDPLIEDCVMRGAADDNIEMRFQPYAKPALLTTVIRRNHLSGARGGDGLQLIDYPGASNRVVRIERNIIRGAAWCGIGSLPDGRTKQGDFSDAPHGSSQVEPIYVLHNTITGNRVGISGGHAMLLLNNLIADSREAAVRRVRGTSAIHRTALLNNGRDYEESVAAEGDLKAATPGAGLASVEWRGEPVTGGPDLGAGWVDDPPAAAAAEKVDARRPSLTVRATSDTARERGAKPGVFTISRSGPRAEALVVRFTLSGEAENGRDYARIGTRATIPAGAAAIEIRIVPVDDGDEEEEEVTLTLDEDPAYALGDPSGASVTIED